MSLALYRIRLYWNGRHGAARHGADIRHLDAAPELSADGGAVIAEIDYAPEVDLAQLREHAADWRAMSDGEIDRVKRYLSGLGPELVVA
jgi:hypothetical protein